MATENFQPHNFRDARGRFRKANTAEVTEAVNQRMAKGLKRFQQEMRDFSKTLLPKQVVLFQKKIAMEVLGRVVRKTPVDTGRARGNWQTSIGTPIEEENVPSRDPINDGKAVIDQIKAYDSIFIVNNVPYIIFLENGSSKQAPNGMALVTLEEVRQAFGR